MVEPRYAYQSPARNGPWESSMATDERVAVRHQQQSEPAIDDALAASFPASDPPAWNPGTARPIPAEINRAFLRGSLPFPLLSALSTLRATGSAETSK